MNRQEHPHRGDLERRMTPRLTKRTMMRAPARIGFCLTYWVWRESMPMVSNDTHKEREGGEKNGALLRAVPHRVQ
jgi:hypothetical protein